MIGIGAWLASNLLGKSVTDKVAKLIGIGALVLGLAVLAGIAVAIHDHRVIQNHDLKQAASNAVADRKADTKAADQRRDDDSRLSTEEAQLKGTNDATKSQTPAERRLARQRCIRLQQAARASGSVAPACG